MGFKMKDLLSVVSLAVLANSKPQLSFGSGSSDDANPRLGLLATNLGLSPTAETEGRTGSLTEFGDRPSGRVPGAPSVGTAPAPASVPASQTSPQDQCCCIPADQGCYEAPVYGNKKCGTRNYPGPVSGLQYGQSSPGEFPWTCILLNQNNDFVGTCAIITDDSSNNNNVPTRKVLTAAHKLKNIAVDDLLKVRVGEWDASGFNAPEQQQHEEYTVVRILKHPGMSTTRLSDNIALLTVDRDINLASPYVNTACMPSCDNQFDYIFSNGTGVRCHVAGWGKDEIDGTFQFIPKKVDLSLVPGAQCEASLKNALNSRQPGTGDRFQLHPSEICAGGEVGKDACVGDGGSPLVCQAQSGRWTVVGLVSWGIGCGSHVPGVYTNVHHYKQWINSIN